MRSGRVRSDEEWACENQMWEKQDKHAARGQMLMEIASKKWLLEVDVEE
jgi:hypothetical protein